MAFSICITCDFRSLKENNLPSNEEIVCYNFVLELLQFWQPTALYDLDIIVVAVLLHMTLYLLGMALLCVLVE